MRLGASLVPRVLAELTCLAVQEVRAITCPGPERFKIGPPEIEPVRTETIDCLQRLSEHDEIEAAILSAVVVPTDLDPHESWRIRDPFDPEPSLLSAISILGAARLTASATVVK
jgi:hypothetical protein